MGTSDRRNIWSHGLRDSMTRPAEPDVTDEPFVLRTQRADELREEVSIRARDRLRDQADDNASTMALYDHPVTTPAVATSTRSMSNSSYEQSSQLQSKLEASVVPGESIADISARLSNEFMPLVERDADTLLYIGPPVQSPGQDDHEYNYIKRHFENPYLMKSSTLRNTGSKKFQRLLGPVSARTERRLKKLGIHQRVTCPSSIKYYIDLRPVTDGDEAILLLTELSVPRGALLWHRTSRDYGVPPSMIHGKDDLNVPLRPKYTFNISDQTDEVTNGVDESQGSEQVDSLGVDTNEMTAKMTEDFLNATEYSPLRHHTAIERLLHAIVGHDPKLNSAPKAWTFCAVAKYFDCATNPYVNNWLTTWLITGNNSNFVQCNPDIVYRMATAMQSPALLRCSYAILTGQKAIFDAKAELDRTSSPDMRTAAHENCLRILNDDEINRIDHAANSLLGRVRHYFYQLIQPATKIPWNSLVNQLPQDVVLNDDKIQERFQEAFQGLQDYFRRRVLQVLCERLTGDQMNASTNNMLASPNLVPVYNGLDIILRALTPQFWVMLEVHKFSLDDYSQMEEREWPFKLKLLRCHGIVDDNDDISYVSKLTLYQKFDELNLVISERNFKLTRSHAAGSPSSLSPLARMDKASLEGDVTYWSSVHNGDCDAGASRVAALRMENAPPTQVVNPNPVKRDFERWNDWEDDWSRTDHNGSNKPSAQSLSPPSSLGKRRVRFDDNGDDDELLKRRSSPRGVTTATELPYRSKSEWPEAHRIPEDAATMRSENLPDFFKAQLDSEHTTQISDEDSYMLSATSHTEEYEPAVFDQRRLVANLPPNYSTSSKNRSNYALHLAAHQNFFSLPAALHDMAQQVSDLCHNQVLLPGYVRDETCTLELPITQLTTLLCLNDDEWKYLPLWAGGLDDGTGGVFNDGQEIPDAPDTDFGGFRGGIRGLDDSEIGSEYAASDFDVVSMNEAASTVNKASRFATDGTKTETATVVSLNE